MCHRSGETIKMKMQNILMIILFLALLFSTSCAATKTPEAVHPAATVQSGYFPDWLAKAPYLPSFEVLDTQSSLGPYAKEAKLIGLKDLIKMHGHPCDGLVT